MDILEHYFMLRVEYRCNSKTTVKDSCYSHCAIFAKQLQSRLPAHIQSTIIGVRWCGVITHWFLKVEYNGGLFFVDGEGIFLSVDSLLNKYPELKMKVTEFNEYLDNVDEEPLTFSLDDDRELDNSLHALALCTEVEDMNSLEGEGNTLVSNWLDTLVKI